MLKKIQKFKFGKEIRCQFPIFSNCQSKFPMAYLDTAASSQKPSSVIERIKHYYEFEHANIHRGAYSLSAKATELYENSRNMVAKFLNAPNNKSVIFTRGTTEAINLIAHSIQDWFKTGDVILLTILEHHSNIVPWQMLAARKKLRIEFVDINQTGQLDMQDFNNKLLKYKPKLCAFTHTSNAIGTTTPVEEITALLKKNNCLAFLDAAQAISTSVVNVTELDVDFLAFSGHKIYGPTGIGILYAKEVHLDRMQPFMGGGDMIEGVDVAGSTWAPAPQKFEAGTPAIAEVAGLASAIEFIDELGINNISEHIFKLKLSAYESLRNMNNLTVYGSSEKSAIISFNLDNIHAHDLATVADTYNVQFRAGHHCAMPLLQRLGISASARISFGVYSCEEDIYQLIEALKRAEQLFK